MKLGADLMLLLLDGLEEQGAAGDMDVSQCWLPMSTANISLFDEEGAALVEASEQAAAEFNVVCQPATEQPQPFLPPVHQHGSFHVVKDLGLARRRVEGRIGHEAQA